MPRATLIAGDFNTCWVEWVQQHNPGAVVEQGCQSGTNHHSARARFEHANRRVRGRSRAHVRLEQRLDSIYTRGLGVRFGGVKRARRTTGRCGSTWSCPRARGSWRRGRASGSDRVRARPPHAPWRYAPSAVAEMPGDPAGESAARVRREDGQSAVLLAIGWLAQAAARRRHRCGRRGPKMSAAGGPRARGPRAAPPRRGAASSRSPPARGSSRWSLQRPGDPRRGQRERGDRRRALYRSSRSRREGPRPRAGFRARCAWTGAAGRRGARSRAGPTRSAIPIAERGAEAEERPGSGVALDRAARERHAAVQERAGGPRACA